MDSIWSVDGVSVQVELTPLGKKGWKATLNGTSVEIVDVQPGRLLLADGRVFDYCADWTQPRKQATLQHAGQTLTVQRQGSQQDGKAGGAGGTASAPMSGQVSKILHQVGDTLAGGEVVLVLEAMKMENEVCAPGSGLLKSIDVRVGENVGPGQKLFHVESTETP